MKVFCKFVTPYLSLFGQLPIPMTNWCSILTKYGDKLDNFRPINATVRSKCLQIFDNSALYFRPHLMDLYFRCDYAKKLDECICLKKIF